MSVQAHEDLVSEVTLLRESLARMKSALDQFETGRKQLREILDQVQRSHEQSSTVLTQVREHKPLWLDRLGRQTTSEGGVQPVSFGWPG